MLIGDGLLLPQLRALACDLQVDKRIIWTGGVDYSAVVPYLNTADLALAYVPQNSQFNLQPPLKTVEFLACGLPTVATATKGNQRFIIHEHNGLLAEDDAVALSEGILRLVTDTALRRRIAETARCSVQQYDWRTIVAERLMPFYQEVLQR